MKLITRKKLNALVGRAYLDGYNKGRLSALSARYTPNEIRKACGLEPIKETGLFYNAMPRAITDDKLNKPHEEENE